MWLYIVIAFVVYYIFNWCSHYPWVADIRKKCVFITGCDSGFGKSAAKSLYRRGVPVFAGCLTEEGARKLREETNDGVETVMIDVSQTKSIEQAYKYISDRLPTGSVLWGIVNNAGIIGYGGPIEFFGRDDYRQTMEVNCLGTVEVVSVFLPLIKKSRGRIVNTASVIAEMPLPHVHPYLISKAGIKAYSEALRHEKAAWGIKVSTVEPGLFKTNIVNMDVFKEKSTDRWNSLDPEIRREYGQEYFDTVLTLTWKRIENNAAPDVKPVIDAYEHALFAKKPYSLYTPGIHSKIFYILANYCPSFIIDILIQKLGCSVLPEVLKRNS